MAGCLRPGKPNPDQGGSPLTEASPNIALIGPSHVWIGRGGHILHSDDAGAHWTVQGAGTAVITEVDMLDTRNGFAVGDTAFLGTTDGGACWRQIGEPSQPLVEVHMNGPFRGWGIEGPVGDRAPQVGVGGTLVRTSDGGHAWTPVNGAPPDAESVCFVDPLHGWLGAAATIARTVDGGATWTPVLWTAARGSATIELECSAPTGVAALSMSLIGAAGNQPYRAYTSKDGVHFTTVFDDMYGGRTPPAGAAPTAVPDAVQLQPTVPGSYPGPFSILTPSTTVWSGATGAVDRPYRVTVELTRGSTVATRMPVGQADVSGGLGFADEQHGWLLAISETASAPALVLATDNGGRTWSVVTTD